MKKVFLLLAIFLIAIGLVACGGETPAETTEAGATDVTTSAQAPVTTVVGTPEETSAAVTTKPSGPEVETEDYTAVLNEEEWKKSDVDVSKYDMFGTGASLVTDINKTYNGYNKKYTLVSANGETAGVVANDVKKLTTVGASLKVDASAKKVEIEVCEIELKIQSSWKYVTAKAGTYLMFEFTSNIPVPFATTVTTKPQGASSSAAYKQNEIIPTGSNGTYTGKARCTVPYKNGSTMYINICLDGGVPTPILTIPLVITERKYDSPYKLIYQGDWDLIQREDYLSDLIDLFYTVYPRLYQRFALNDAKVPTTITFVADKNYNGAAYCSGDKVCVSTDFANGSPYDIGFFAHELTHSVQQYGGRMYYGDSAWWTEFMADLGRFRYFHWGYSTKYLKFYSMDDPAIRDWGYQPYGQHNIFASYLDLRYGSKQNEDGTVTLGLMDSLNKLIKETKVELSDNPYNVNSPFNQTVKQITGFDCMEDLRLHFVEELDNKTYVFTGYANATDNFLTENIPGLDNPEYPMNEPVKKGDKTAAALATPVTEGNNIAKGAAITFASSQGGTRNPIANLLDGDLATMFQGPKVTDDYRYELGGYKHEFVIDLGATKTFDTYTLVNSGSKSTNKNNNTAEWEIFVSEEGKTWTSVDYQSGNKADIASFNVGDTTARYVKLRIFTTDQNANVGTVRLYEFMLFDQQ